MTNDNDSINPINIELGALAYEVVIAIQSVSVGVEQIANRPDVPALMKEPLAILLNLANRATEASIILQDAMFKTFGLSGVSDLKPLDPYNPDDFSGADGDDDPS